MAEIKLEDFVAETLRAISVGVKRARVATQEANSPPVAPINIDGEIATNGEQLVKFVISVEASTETVKSGKGEVKGVLVTVVSGGLSGELTKASHDKNAQIIEFSVPVYFNANWVSLSNGKS